MKTIYTIIFIISILGSTAKIYNFANQEKVSVVQEEVKTEKVLEVKKSSHRLKIVDVERI